MTKEELAEKYANEQASEFASKIKEAYLKGYEQGELKTASTVKIDGVVYVDLGLPSGTLWSKTPLLERSSNIQNYKLISYHGAQKLNIPTKKQVDELIDSTKKLIKDGVTYAIGPNSSRICYEWYEKGEGEVESSSSRHCWIKGKVVVNEASALIINEINGFIGTSDYFTGYKLPVFLVKNKADL